MNHVCIRRMIESTVKTLVSLYNTIDQSAQPSSANYTPVDASSRGWGRYLQVSIDPVGVEIGKYIF